MTAAHAVDNILYGNDGILGISHIELFVGNLLSVS